MNIKDRQEAGEEWGVRGRARENGWWGAGPPFEPPWSDGCCACCAMHCKAAPLRRPGAASGRCPIGNGPFEGFNRRGRRPRAEAQQAFRASAAGAWGPSSCGCGQQQACAIGCRTGSLGPASPHTSDPFKHVHDSSTLRQRHSPSTSCRQLTAAAAACPWLALPPARHLALRLPLLAQVRY